MIYRLQKESILKPCEDLTIAKSSLTFSLLTPPKHAVIKVPKGQPKQRELQMGKMNNNE